MIWLDFHTTTFLLNISLLLDAGGTLLELNQRRLELINVHAYVLGAWALINLVVGGWLTYILWESQREAFHHMNASWNVFNALVVWYMFASIAGIDPATLSLAESIEASFSVQKALALNIGLDAMYMAAGMALYQFGRRTHLRGYLWRGFGYSMQVQGAFLILLDIVFYILHTNQNELIHNLLTR